MIRYPRAVPPVLAALIVTVGPAFGGAQIASLPPVDEASRDSSLLRFRGDVLPALQRRDTAFNVSIVALNLGNGFGGDAGVKDCGYSWLGGCDRNRMLEQLRASL